MEPLMPELKSSSSDIFPLFIKFIAKIWFTHSRVNMSDKQSFTTTTWVGLNCGADAGQRGTYGKPNQTKH